MNKWLEGNGADPRWEERAEKMITFLHTVLTPALEAIRLGPDADGMFACRLCHARTNARIFRTWKAMICPACHHARAAGMTYRSTPTRTKRHMRGMEES